MRRICDRRYTSLLSDGSARQALSEVLKIIVSGIKSTADIKDLEGKNQRLETENNHLKIMLSEANQNFKDLVDILKKIIKEDTPPGSEGERRNRKKSNRPKRRNIFRNPDHLLISWIEFKESFFRNNVVYT
jgi:hypothetical protein